MKEAESPHEATPPKNPETDKWSDLKAVPKAESPSTETAKPHTEAKQEALEKIIKAYEEAAQEEPSLSPETEQKTASRSNTQTTKTSAFKKLSNLFSRLFSRSKPEKQTTPAPSEQDIADHNQTQNEFAQEEPTPSIDPVPEKTPEQIKEEEYLIREINRERTETFKKQRIQEIVERDLNSRLTRIENLETAVLAEEPGISKEFVPFEGKEIPVYTLSGYPFSMLQTTIDYRSAAKVTNPDIIGGETAESVMQNPAVWAQNRSEAEKSSSFGTRNKDARGDVISTSYVESETNMDDCAQGELIYGFEQTEADSILLIAAEDGATSNIVGKGKTKLEDPRDINSVLDPKTNHGKYNEILLRRYYDGGKAKLPDYIIVRRENGQIPEVALRHAAYFGIPIVRINMKPYREEGYKKREEILSSITEEDSYVDITRKLDEAMKIRPYQSALSQRERFMNEPLGYDGHIHESYKYLEIEEKKRLDFIKETLEKAIRLELSSEDGKDSKDPFSDLDEFSASFDLGEGFKMHIYFKIKGSPRMIKTWLFNTKKERESGHMPIDHDDETILKYYDEIEKLLRQYIDICQQKNKHPGK